jgi:hypothetical protein
VRADVVDRDDVRMVQGPGEPRLLLEPGEERGIAGQAVADDLEGHVPLQPGVTGAVDLGHAS